MVFYYVAMTFSSIIVGYSIQYSGICKTYIIWTIIQVLGLIFIGMCTTFKQY